MKNKERADAVDLRRAGFSLGDISKKLGIAKSTASVWTRGVELSEKQLEILHGRMKLAHERGVKKLSDMFRAKRAEYQDLGRGIAKTGDINFIAGCSLYWAEGHKRNNRNQIHFCNSDPRMVSFFVRFLTGRLSVDASKIRIRITAHIRNGKKDGEILKFWNNVLGDLQYRDMLVSFVKPSKYSKNRKGASLPFGTCHILVGDVCAIQKIYGGIQEYFGIVVPEWLG